MAIQLSKWFHLRKERADDYTLEKVEPMHPEDYPARHLKQILDHRRFEFEERMSHPTGMPDGPGPLS